LRNSGQAEREVPFSPEYSMGDLYVRDWNISGAYEAWWLHFVYWEKFGNGIDRVVVPANQQLGLHLKGSGRKNIDLLRFLDKSAIQGICGYSGQLDPIKHFSTLRRLSIEGGRQTTDSDLNDLSSLIDLELISLFSGCDIDTGFECLKDLSRLEVLGIGSWGKPVIISDQAVEAIANTKSIKRLALMKVKNISDDAVVRLAQLESLEELNLVDVDLSAKGAESLKDLPLLELALSGNEITDDKLLLFAEGRRKLRKTLKVLRIISPNVTDAGIGAIFDSIPMDGVESCVLSLPNCTGRIVNRIEEMVGLKRLYLDQLPLSKEHLVAISRLNKLERFRSIGGSITDEGLACLGGCRNLRRLHLRDNLVSAEAVQSIKNVLPKCKVQHDVSDS